MSLSPAAREHARQVALGLPPPNARQSALMPLVWVADTAPADEARAS